MKQFASGHAMQSAWVVDDLDAAVDAWLKVGIGPFFFVEYTPDLFEDSTYRGTPSPISMKIALAQAGDMQIELIEPTGEQANIYRDTVPEGQTAFHHLCYWTDDLEGEIASLGAQGYELAATGTVAGSGATFAYVDTSPVLGPHDRAADLLGRHQEGSLTWWPRRPLTGMAVTRSAQLG